MRSICLIFILIFCSLKLFATDKVLFEIGRQDNSAAEFALYPDNYKSFLANFGGEKSFYVGYSTPENIGRMFCRVHWIAGLAVDTGPDFIRDISLLSISIWTKRPGKGNVLLLSFYRSA